MSRFRLSFHEEEWIRRRRMATEKDTRFKAETQKKFEFGVISGDNGDGTYKVQVAGRSHPYDSVGVTDQGATFEVGDQATLGFEENQAGLPVVISRGRREVIGKIMSSIATNYAAITWSQMEGTPENGRVRWAGGILAAIYVPTWSAGGYPPSELVLSKPAHDLPFVATATSTELGAYSPVYGFVMFPNKAGQQCLAHAYLDFNAADSISYIVVKCYNLADPTKSWEVSGPFAATYTFAEWDQTNNLKTEPNQKRMAYDKEFHQIVLFYPSYSNSLFAGMYLFDAENGFPHFSGLDGNKTVNNISFGKTSIMSAWWRSVRKVVPTVMVPNTVYPHHIHWVNNPTGAVDLSSINEDFIEIWKKSKVENLVEGVTYTDYVFTQKLLKSTVVDGDLTVGCSANNNLRWPYSRKSDGYATAVITGSGLDLSNMGHRMTLAAGVGYVPQPDFYKDVWTTPENPAVEVSMLTMDRYKLHFYVKLDIYIHDSNGAEIYHDSIIKFADETFEDPGTFEYTSTAIPFSDMEPSTTSDFEVVDGFHVESVDPPPETYLSYDQIVEEKNTVSPGVTFSGHYLGYVTENSQNLANTRTPINWNSGGTTGTIDETVSVEDWEDPSPIQYWAFGEGFHYHKEKAVHPAFNGGTSQNYASSGRADQGYQMDPGSLIQFPILSILQGLPCVFPLPIRNNLVGWSARLFAPTDTSQPGGVPLPSNASGVFDDDGNYYIAYAMPEVWVRGCADQDKHFYFESVEFVPYDTATLGRYSTFYDLTNYRVVSALTAGVNEYPLPYPTNTWAITGFEVVHGQDAYSVHTVKYGMVPISETVYRTYLRKVKFTPGAIDSHGVQAPGAYATDWDTNFSYYLQFISPADTDGDFVSKQDARGTPVPVDEHTSYLPLKWFPLVSTPRPILEQIWSITPVRAKATPRNRLIVILDKRVNENINIESVPFCYIFDSDSGNIIGNVDISQYIDATVDDAGLYQFNYYYHDEPTVSEAITARGGPEIIVNHDNLGNSIAIIKVWRQDRITNEKSFLVTTLYFNGDGFMTSSTNIVEGFTGSNGWAPYETLKALGSFNHIAFGDVIYFYDLASGFFKTLNRDTDPGVNTVIQKSTP